jgi:signal transduction histidine kinase
MARALRNLLDNAIRHTPTNGRVRLQVGVEDGNAFVSIADECGGIPDLDLPRVFEPAFRGTTARSPGDGHSGLGLAIVQSIVEAHHGDISVQNLSTGCQFVLRLALEDRGKLRYAERSWAPPVCRRDQGVTA